MRVRYRTPGAVRSLLAAVALAVATAGTAIAAPIPISHCGAVLDKPGATYVLTKDLDCTLDGVGLIICASNITLDMQGHTIRTLGGIGILVKPVTNYGWLSNVYICNGKITGCAAGILLAAPDRVTIRGMTIYRNFVGIVGGMSNHSIVYNLVAENAFDGIYLVGPGHHICNNRVVRNGNEKLFDDIFGPASTDVPLNKKCEDSVAGIRVEMGDGARIICNTVTDTQGFGISVEGDDVVMFNNTAGYNERSGLRLLGADGLILRNRSSGNGQNGIRLPRFSKRIRVEENVAMKNLRHDIWDGNLPGATSNTYKKNMFETSNDATGTVIK